MNLLPRYSYHDLNESNFYVEQVTKTVYESWSGVTVEKKYNLAVSHVKTFARNLFKYVFLLLLYM